jgi:hypothetical protein
MNAGGPALSLLVETGNFLRATSNTGTFEGLLGLLQIESECRGLQFKQLTVCFRSGKGERESSARAKCDLHRPWQMINEVLHRFMALRIRDGVVVIQYQDQSARDVYQTVECRRDDLV